MEKNNISRVRNLNFLILGLVIVLSILLIYFFIYKKQPVQAKVIETIIPVEGMTCGSCEYHIETEVKNCEGILEIKADHKKGEVYAKYDNSKISEDELVEAINKTGYKATKP